MVEVGRSLVNHQKEPQVAYVQVTHSMTPVLVTSNDARSIVLVVQVPGSIGVDEHAIGIVHEILHEVSKNVGRPRFQDRLPTCGGLKWTLGRYGPV